MPTPIGIRPAKGQMEEIRKLSKQTKIPQSVLIREGLAWVIKKYQKK